MKITASALFLCYALALFAGEPIIHDPAKIAEIHEKAGEPVPSLGYVHRWIPFPSYSALFIKAGKVQKIPERGQIEVVFFLASWCTPCQEAIQDFEALKKKYDHRNVSFTYLFSHDTKPDVKAFMEFYKISDGALAEHNVLKDFHNPPLPTIYISDKDGWILTRYEKLTRDDLKKVDETLQFATTD